MGRVIEFRAWNKYHKKMHSVYEINFDHSIAKTRDNEIDSTHTFGFIDLELMQFTGLRDKNGVKIFCGDILDEDGSLFIVVWDDEWAKFKLQYASPKSIQYPEWNRGKKMIIVGNIHQHPHLLDK